MISQTSSCIVKCHSFQFCNILHCAMKIMLYIAVCMTVYEGHSNVLRNTQLMENERQDSACCIVVVRLACLLTVATGLVRFRHAMFLLCHFS
jgi:predicted histidine transporter YuiF (NhaC family)